MSRGQSSVEYLLGVAVIVLGVVAAMLTPRLWHALRHFHHDITARVGTDAVQ
ncbi:MAG: hypothetical protein HY696_09365 [Deltaproteobacteria bacterium]|nr:hypothetical protein [Deltaproteobacteria bacterium]